MVNRIHGIEQKWAQMSSNHQKAILDMGYSNGYVPPGSLLWRPPHKDVQMNELLTSVIVGQITDNAFIYFMAKLGKAVPLNSCIFEYSVTICTLAEVGLLSQRDAV